jgi:hypothetical protein
MLSTAMGRDDEAAALLRRALTIFTHALPDTHPHVRACREHVARVQGQPPGAPEA